MRPALLFVCAAMLMAFAPFSAHGQERAEPKEKTETASAPAPEQKPAAPETKTEAKPEPENTGINADVGTENDTPPAPDTLALLTSPSQGALPPDIWAGTPFNMLSAALARVSAQSGTLGSASSLLIRMMSTQADAPAAIPAPGDWLALRLEALNDFGAYAQSAAIYAAALETDANPGERLRRAGLSAFVAQGQLSAACLDLLTNPPAQKDVPFWARLTSLCDTLKDTGATAPAPVGRTFKQIDAMAFFDIAAARHEGGLAVSAPQPRDVMTAKPMVLGMFIPKDAHSAADLSIVAEAHRRGILDTAAYDRVFSRAAMKPPADIGGGPWQQAIALYNQFFPKLTDGTPVTPPPAPTADMLTRVLSLSALLGTRAMTPFLDSVEGYADVKSLPVDTLAKGALFLALHDSALTHEWTRLLIHKTKKDAQAIEKYKVYYLIGLLWGSIGEDEYRALFEKTAENAKKTPEPAESSPGEAPKAPADSGTGAESTALSPDSSSLYEPWERLAGRLSALQRKENLSYGKNIRLTGLIDYVMDWLRDKPSLRAKSIANMDGLAVLISLETLATCPGTQCDVRAMTKLVDIHAELGLHNEARKIMTEMIVVSFLGQRN